MTYRTLYVDQISRGAKSTGQRTGQYLFNHLPDGAANVIAGSLFDPFHKDLSPYEIRAWLGDHLIFSPLGEVIAVFNQNDILWTEEKDNA